MRLLSSSRKDLHFTIITVILVLFVSFSANSQNNNNGQDALIGPLNPAVPFLRIAPDARGSSMGDAGVATSPDVNAMFYNAGKLAFLEDEYGFSLSYSPWLKKVVDDMYISYLSGYYKISQEQAIGLEMRYFNMGDIQLRDEQGDELETSRPREYSLAAAYSRKLSDNLGLSLTGRFINSNVLSGINVNGSAAKRGIGASMDLAVYYNQELRNAGRPSELALGAQISNIGTKISYLSPEEADFIPTNLKLGAAYTVNLDQYNKLTFTTDINKLMIPTPTSNRDTSINYLSGVLNSFSDAPGGFSEEMQEIMLSGGIEYWYQDVAAFRGGYFYESDAKGGRRYLTAGFGLRYQVMGFDMSYLVPRGQDHPLAGTLRVSVVMNFEGGTQESIQDER